MTWRKTKPTTRWLIVPNEMEAHPELWGPYQTEGERDKEIARLADLVHRDVFAYTLTINLKTGVPEVELVFPDDFEDEDFEEEDE